MSGELWITYKPHYGASAGNEPIPVTYSGVVIFDSEIEALRSANRNGTTAVTIRPGQTLGDAIQAARPIRTRRADG